MVNTTQTQPRYHYWLRPNGNIATSTPSPLNGKSLHELIIMAETRRLLQLLIHSKREETSPDLITTIEALLRSRLRRTSPFLPLNEHQRIAWLDEYTHIQCRAPLAEFFAAGESYRVDCHDAPTSQIVDRQTLGGQPEEVLVTGRELLITVRDRKRHVHAFSHAEIPADPNIDIDIHFTHHIQALIDHFLIPPTPDITRVYPSTYKKYKEALSNL
jgi:hypothetical protein